MLLCCFIWCVQIWPSVLVVCLSPDFFLTFSLSFHFHFSLPFLFFPRLSGLLMPGFSLRSAGSWPAGAGIGRGLRLGLRSDRLPGRPVPGSEAPPVCFSALRVLGRLVPALVESFGSAFLIALKGVFRSHGNFAVFLVGRNARQGLFSAV